MEKYTYLLINLLSVSIPFVFSFHRKLNFVSEWKSFWPACLITALLFILWDCIFTSLGVWGFNKRYIIDIQVFNLPVEEILFFICIPYACVFTYHALQKILSQNLSSLEKEFTWILITTFFMIGIYNYDKLYTFITFILCGSFILYLRLFMKSEWIGKIYLAYAFILPGFFISNGILTGTGIEEEVVWYNNRENLEIRIGTIPVEDIFYGLLLIMMNVVLFEKFRQRKLL